MKKRIDLFWYWFIFVVAFVLCFFVVNDKKVNAYELDNNGNLVSSNLFNVNGFNAVSGSNELLNLENNDTITLNGNSNNYVGYIDFDYITLKANTEYVFKLFNSSKSGDYNCLSFIFPSGTTNIRQFDFYFYSNSPYKIIVGNQDTYIESVRIYLANNLTNYDNYNFGIMVSEGDTLYSTYEPYGVWYSQNNYDSSLENSYDEGYQNGYDDGYVENNSIPTIYLENAIVYYNSTNPTNGNSFTMFQDVTSSITNLNATLNFNSFININWGSLVRDNQIFHLNIKTITSIGVDDVLRFSFNDVSNSNNFSSRFSITFGDASSCGGVLDNCNSFVTLSYADIVNSNYEIVLSEFNSNLDVAEFNFIMISFYRENGFMYGISEIIDTSLLSDFDTQYDIGYKVGYINGNDAGVIEGEKVGYDKGYKNGYNKGIMVSNVNDDNSLVGMVGAIMTSPVNMLKTIFDFEFLGVNLSQFLFSLISLLIVIWLIKFFL